MAELERQYVSLQARLNKETASSGDPLAVAERYKATKLRYKQIKDDLDRHQCLLKVFFTIDVYDRYTSMVVFYHFARLATAPGGFLHMVIYSFSWYSLVKMPGSSRMNALFTHWICSYSEVIRVLILIM